MTSHCTVHEFLTANLFGKLVTHLARRQGLFKPSDRERDAVRVLEEFGPLQEPLAAAMLEAVPDVAPRCGLEPFDAAQVDLRATSRGAAPSVATRDEVADCRALGFVLFVHREPRQFTGGTLHLRSAASESIIEPSQNSIVFFPSSSAVQVGAIHAASGALVDSRLTLEGWICARHGPNSMRNCRRL